jgi:hypothetical protein
MDVHMDTLYGLINELINEGKLEEDVRPMRNGVPTTQITPAHLSAILQSKGLRTGGSEEQQVQVRGAHLPLKKLPSEDTLLTPCCPLTSVSFIPAADHHFILMHLVQRLYNHFGRNLMLHHGHGNATQLTVKNEMAVPVSVMVVWCGTRVLMEAGGGSSWTSAHPTSEIEFVL